MQDIRNSSWNGDEAWDTLHDPGHLVRHWTTDNVGEAAPGVLTPLGWSLWGNAGELTLRRLAHAVGAFSREEAEAAPRDGDRICRIFYGRLAQPIEAFADLGDRMPGTSGRQIAEGLFGTVPEDMTFRPTKRRYPIIAFRLPYCAIASPHQVRARARTTDAWWRREIQRVRTLDEAAAQVLFARAAEEHLQVLRLHAIALISVVQPLYQGLAALIERSGVGDAGLLSGSGGAEMAIVNDIWRASRGEIGIAEVIANHGFHGPLEGELSSRVWREAPEPLVRLIAEYAGRPDAEDPATRDTARQVEAETMRQELLAALPRAKRPGARILLRVAARQIPLRGVGKRSFLQALDVARAAARRLGELLVDDGVLEDVEDVFYLTAEELTGALPRDPQDLVDRRRERRNEYLRIELPTRWTGTPDPIHHGAVAASSDEGARVVSGVGVSAGTAVGLARVVSDPSFAEVEPDEILVAPLTDPSWASIMFVSAGLVVDIGGPMSHAAVVARELGLPCVVNTQCGTRRLRTGDRIRVDGTAGTVEILARATS